MDIHCLVSNLYFQTYMENYCFKFDKFNDEMIGKKIE